MSFGNRALWKWLEIVFGVASLLIGLGDFWLSNQYARTLSSVADPGTGRTLPFNMHGHIVYLTNGEHARLYGLIFSSGVLFVLAVLIDLLKKPFRE
ncbi:MAG: hypothetical protein WB994_10590 [Candidatus Acidiferrum sp.]